MVFKLLSNMLVVCTLLTCSAAPWAWGRSSYEEIRNVGVASQAQSPSAKEDSGTSSEGQESSAPSSRNSTSDQGKRVQPKPIEAKALLPVPQFCAPGDLHKRGVCVVAQEEGAGGQV